MAPEILTKIIVLEIAQRCSVEVLKLSCMGQKLYLGCDQNMRHFTDRVKNCVSHTIQKENSRIGPMSFM